MSEEAVKVFISYSWDSSKHKEKVLALSDSLRKHGIDCQIDRYHQSPSQGWYRWMMDQIEESDFVLVVCTEKYNLRYRNKDERGQGRGVTWEGGQIIAELYSEQGINEKYIPVLLSSEGENYIPRSLQTYTIYRLLSNDDYDLNKPGDYQNLYRHLTKQPAYVPAQLGKSQILLPISGAASTVGDQGEIIQAENLIIVKEQVEREKIQREQQAEAQEKQRQAERLKQQEKVAEQQRLQELERQRSAAAQHELASEKGIDYTQLRDLLKAGKWKEADQETAARMCEAVTSMLRNEGLLKRSSIPYFPRTDVRTIDTLWVEQSQSRFGFSVQKKIWQKCGSLSNYSKQLEKFGEEVGWREKVFLGLFKEWKSYSQLTFNISAPVGHLPLGAVWGWRYSMGVNLSSNSGWGGESIFQHPDL